MWSRYAYTGGLRIAAWNVNSQGPLPSCGLLPPAAEGVPAGNHITMKLPVAELESGGTRLLRARKTYNGVALVSRSERSTCRSASGPGGRTKRSSPPRRRRALVWCTAPMARAVPTSTPTSSLVRCPHAWLQDELARHPKLAVLGDTTTPRRPRRPDPRLEAACGIGRNASASCTAGAGPERQLPPVRRPKAFSWWITHDASAVTRLASTTSCFPTARCRCTAPDRSRMRPWSDRRSRAGVAEFDLPRTKKRAP